MLEGIKFVCGIQSQPRLLRLGKQYSHLKAPALIFLKTWISNGDFLTSFKRVFMKELINYYSHTFRVNDEVCEITHYLKFGVNASIEFAILNPVGFCCCCCCIVRCCCRCEWLTASIMGGFISLLNLTCFSSTSKSYIFPFNRQIHAQHKLYTFCIPYHMCGDIWYVRIRLWNSYVNSSHLVSQINVLFSILLRQHGSRGCVASNCMMWISKWSQQNSI